MSQMTSVESFPRPGHDHKACVADALRHAEAAFTAKGLRMTPLRRRVLKQIASSHLAKGAYDLLEDLSKRGQRLAPISVYRALDALVEAGVVHKLEGRKAYFACHAGGDCLPRPIALVCRSCGAVAELPAETIRSDIEAAADGLDFSCESTVIEVYGRCAHCRSAASEVAEQA